MTDINSEEIKELAIKVEEMNSSLKIIASQSKGIKQVNLSLVDMSIVDMAGLYFKVALASLPLACTVFVLTIVVQISMRI
ncbi:hypothetical protein [Marinobacter salexigens]|uniref:hypothetical protein n=1 Tax=Marinobacter salexigens TaxID=1925763 RepID=UPI000C28B87E|nr:hypothetical protein [Marinobacter salexigens]